MVAGMFMPLDQLRAIYEVLFREGVMVAKKDRRPRSLHPHVPGVTNLQVMRAMASLRARGLVRGPGAAAAGAGGTTSPPHTHTGREAVAEKMLQLLRQSCPTRPFRPLVSGSGECVLGKRKLDYLRVCRGSAALGALGSNLS